MKYSYNVQQKVFFVNKTFLLIKIVENVSTPYSLQYTLYMLQCRLYVLTEIILSSV